MDSSTDFGPPNRDVYFKVIFFERWRRREVADILDVVARRDRGAADAGDGLVLVLSARVDIRSDCFVAGAVAAGLRCCTCWPRYRKAALDADAGRLREPGVTKHVFACALAGRTFPGLCVLIGGAVVSTLVGPAGSGSEDRGSAAARIWARSCKRARACARASASCCPCD